MLCLSDMQNKKGKWILQKNNNNQKTLYQLDLTINQSATTLKPIPDLNVVGDQ